MQGKRDAIATLIRRLAAEQNPEKTFDFPNLGFEEETEEKTAKSGELKLQHEQIKINLKPKVQTSGDANVVKRTPSEPLSSLASHEPAGGAESSKLQWKKARLSANC